MDLQAHPDLPQMAWVVQAEQARSEVWAGFPAPHPQLAAFPAVVALLSAVKVVKGRRQVVQAACLGQQDQAALPRPQVVLPEGRKRGRFR